MLFLFIDKLHRVLRSARYAGVCGTWFRKPLINASASRPFFNCVMEVPKHNSLNILYAHFEIFLHEQGSL